MKRKQKTARATAASAALRVAYYKKLMNLVNGMQRSTDWWIGAIYRKNESRIALDASPSSELESQLREQMGKWSKEFDGISGEIADWFIKRTSNYTDRSVLSALKDVGYTVKFKMSPRMRDVLQSIVAEQVNLIKSIESQYFTDVTGLVMRSVQEGRDLFYLKEELQNRYGITSRRAATIARDQNNKATAMLAHTRYGELGITEAYWRHNAGSKTPRPDHVAADGKPYDITKGLLIKGKLTFPGQDVNCHCTSRPVIPEFDNR